LARGSRLKPYHREGRRETFPCTSFHGRRKVEKREVLNTDPRSGEGSNLVRRTLWGFIDNTNKKRRKKETKEDYPQFAPNLRWRLRDRQTLDYGDKEKVQIEGKKKLQTKGLDPRRQQNEERAEPEETSKPKCST